MKKRNLFNELMEGFDALEAERMGKDTVKKVIHIDHPVSPAKPRGKTADELLSPMADAGRLKNRVH